MFVGRLLKKLYCWCSRGKGGRPKLEEFGNMLFYAETEHVFFDSAAGLRVRGAAWAKPSALRAQAASTGLFPDLSSPEAGSLRK